MVESRIENVKKQKSAKHTSKERKESNARSE